MRALAQLLEDPIAGLTEANQISRSSAIYPQMVTKDVSSSTRAPTIEERELGLEDSDLDALSALVYAPRMNQRITAAFKNDKRFIDFLAAQGAAGTEEMRRFATHIHSSEIAFILCPEIYSEQCVQNWVMTVMLYPAPLVLRAFMNPNLSMDELKLVDTPCFASYTGPKTRRPAHL